jgi:hypothetical protein
VRIAWLQVIVAFILGGLLGQRFVHLHPVSQTRAANGYA